ncbi:sterol desaturase family protein [Rhizobium leguminosarum]|uniref:sterol desaturase family protein n=2 Tax=Rhizobium leguminosarum TaxID=384 RepID=UPI001C8FFAFE|nr:sterol desaturase family protein [Rhizobium leguminosarum]MBY3021811.1 sterol desaturase family protein [Rhizobium leguminosarum]
MELVVEYCLHKLGGFFYKTYYLNGEAMALSFAISIGLVLTVFAVELTYVGFGNSGFRRVFFERSKSTITDIVYFVLQATGMITLFAVLASFGLSYAITRAAQDAPHLDLAGRLPGWAHVLLFLVLSDFLSYWQHRLMHRLPVLWRLHEFHHAAEEFNALTSSREHPLEKAINMAIMVVPALLIGLPTAEFAFVTITFGAIGLVKHSAIPWHGWFGKYVIQSPRDHFIHHSRVREHHDKNFANYFPIWDHLFGTYYEGDADGAKLGLDRDYFNQTDPFRESIATEIRFFQRAGQAAKAKCGISLISGKPASPQGLSGPEERR